MKQFILFSAVQNTFTLLLQKPYHVLLSFVLDILFLLSYGFFIPPVRQQVIQQSLAITEMLIQQFRTRTPITIFHALLQEPSLLITTTLFIALFFAIYILFQGMAWYVAHNIHEQHITLKTYLTKFVMLNLFWLPVFIIYKIVDVLFGIRGVLLLHIAKQEQTILVPLFLWSTLFLFLALNFLSISCPLLRVRTSILFFKRHWKLTLCMYTLIASWLLSIVFLTKLMQLASPGFSFVFAGILFLFFLVFSRTFIIQTILLIEKQHHEHYVCTYY